MGVLDGVLGGAVGAEMVTVVNSLIQQHGGLQGVVTQLEQQGLGGVRARGSAAARISRSLPSSCSRRSAACSASSPPRPG
jgi:hypothetical protein